MSEKDIIIGRFMLLVSQALLYGPWTCLTAHEREELAGLIGAWEALKHPHAGGGERDE